MSLWERQYYLLNMSYAIIKTGGKQIKVKVGSQIWIEKITKEVGDQVKFDNVLVVSANSKFEIGKPTLNALVLGKIEKQGKNQKIRILRTKAKSNWKRSQGHRQPYTRVLIEEIILNDKVIARLEIDKIIKKDNKKTEQQKDIVVKALPDSMGNEKQISDLQVKDKIKQEKVIDEKSDVTQTQYLDVNQETTQKNSKMVEQDQDLEKDSVKEQKKEIFNND